MEQHAITIGFSLGGVRIDLASPDKSIQESYAALLRHAPPAAASPESEIIIHLRFADRLPARPAEEALFGTSPDNADAHAPPNLLEVYRGEDELKLFFPDVAAVSITDQQISGVVTPAVWQAGRFSDVIYTSLAPVLRRNGIYLVHAAAVGQQGHGILLVGPSGSGKTTTSLALAARGWRYLANDVAAVQETSDGIAALPTPDLIGVTRETLQLLSGPDPGASSGGGHGRKRPLPSHVFVSHSNEAVLIRQIVFPKVSNVAAADLSPLPPSLALAWLIESSLDRWDQECASGHIEALSRLCQQARPYELHLSRDLNSIAALFQTG